MGNHTAVRGFLVSVSLLVLVTSASLAEDVTDRKTIAKVDEFFTEKAKVKEATLKNFDKTIDRWKSNRALTPGARQDKAEQWKRARDHFDSTEQFLEEEQFTGIEFDYHVKISRCYAPVATLFHQRMEDALKADDHKLVDDIQVEKLRTERRLLGPMEFTGPSAWCGTFDRPGGTIPYCLFISDIKKGGSFAGHVEDNIGIPGNWAYDLEGHVDGRVFEYTMTKSVRGGFQKLVAVGVVSGNRVMIRVTQKIGGSTHTGFAILKKG